MHERSIYRNPPSFINLAKKYDFFAPFLTMDAGGNARVNFRDPEALRALSRALLLQDFGLDVTIPKNTLVPTIPLRLNYILWIEDLLQSIQQGQEGHGGVGSGSEINGIDIGTGATVVYALLGAKKNGWNIIGTEVDPDSLKIASENVIRNNLTTKVKIVRGSEETFFIDFIPLSMKDGYFSFTMCNPPFFENEGETDYRSIRKGRLSADDNLPRRPPPSAARTGEGAELVVKGGELEFISRMIAESVQFSRKIKIFTTMVGIKRHLKTLLGELKGRGVTNFTTTEFIQGKTMRWGLAWSTYPGVNLIPPNPDIIGHFPNFSRLICFQTLMHSYLQELKPQDLNWLSMSKSNYAPDVEDDEGNEKRILEFVAFQNTWSNQRRLRRELERKKGQGGPKDSKVRKLSQESNGQNTMEEGVDMTDAVSVCSSSPSKPPEDEVPVLVNFLMEFTREEEAAGASIVMTFRRGTLGKDGMNQILQFLKNRYDRDLKDPSSQVYQVS